MPSSRKLWAYPDAPLDFVRFIDAYLLWRVSKRLAGVFPPNNFHGTLFNLPYSSRSSHLLFYQDELGEMGGIKGSAIGEIIQLWWPLAPPPFTSCSAAVSTSCSAYWWNHCPFSLRLHLLNKIIFTVLLKSELFMVLMVVLIVVLIVLLKSQIRDLDCGLDCALEITGPWSWLCFAAISTSCLASFSTARVGFSYLYLCDERGVLHRMWWKLHHS